MRSNRVIADDYPLSILLRPPIKAGKPKHIVDEPTGGVPILDMKEVDAVTEYALLVVAFDPKSLLCIQTPQSAL